MARNQKAGELSEQLRGITKKIVKILNIFYSHTAAEEFYPSNPLRRYRNVGTNLAT